MATGRKGALATVEVIDLSDPSVTCNNLPDLPNGLKGPTGQLFNKTLPILCGGVEFDRSKDLCECFAYVKVVNSNYDYFFPIINKLYLKVCKWLV